MSPECVYPLRDAIFPTRERENSLFKKKPSKKAVFFFFWGGGIYFFFGAETAKHATKAYAESPESEIPAKFFTDMGEKCGEKMAKFFADWGLFFFLGGGIYG